MPYLDAALAFALTMLAVSTLVTWILRVGQYLARIRQGVMKQMLVDYFNGELKPVVEREMARLQSAVGSVLIAEAEKLKADSLYDRTFGLFTEDQYKNLTDLSREELVEWLKRTEMGGKMLKELGDNAASVFDELGKRYDAVGAKFTKSFRDKSRIWATGVALLVAFLLNIDSIFIANTYMKNEGMRQAVIAQKDSLEAGYNELQEQLAADVNKETISREDFDQAFKDAGEKLDIFTSAGFPIGFSYYPYICLKEPESPGCAERSKPDVLVTVRGWQILVGDLTWLLGIILTALLAGLGGPFWYDVVAGISRAVQSTRAAAKKAEG